MYIYITLCKGWGTRRKMDNNLWVVREMRVGVELGNKLICRNRENSKARNEEVIIQLILFSKVNLKARRDASSQMYLRTDRYPTFPTLSHGRLLSFVFLKYCKIQRCQSWAEYITKPAEMKLLEIKVTGIKSV